MKTLMRLNYNKLDVDTKFEFCEAVRGLKAERISDTPPTNT